MNRHKGFIAPIILIIIALIIGGGAYVYVRGTNQSQQTTVARSNEFTVLPTVGSSPLSVTFSYILLDTNSTSPSIYQVDFGDNSTATGDMQETRCAGECRKFVAPHVYANPGTYTAKLIQVVTTSRSSGRYVGTVTVTVK